MTLDRHINNSAKIGKNFKCGYGVAIQDNVTIGDNVELGNYVIIYPFTVIGNGTVVGDYAVLGKMPRLSPSSTVKAENLASLIIGEGCTIGTSTVVFAGSSISDNVTVGDNVFIREKCTVGPFTVLGRGVSVENESLIGANCKVQTGAYITAYAVLEDHVFIAPMVVTTNDNFMGRTEKRFELKKGPHIRRGARVGAGAIILPGITIGEEAFVAAGAVVTKDVPGRKLVMGVPARVARDVPEEELLG